MLNSEAIALTHQALWLILLLSAPAVITAAAVGMVIAVFQAATQIQEQTLQYAAKFATIAITLFVTASLLGGTLYSYTDRIMNEFPVLVRR